MQKVVTCAYTFTEDHSFFGQARERALIVSAWSGHGDKFGAAVGRRVAACVVDGDHDWLVRWLWAELPPRRMPWLHWRSIPRVLRPSKRPNMLRHPHCTGPYVATILTRYGPRTGCENGTPALGPHTAPAHGG